MPFQVINFSVPATERLLKELVKMGPIPMDPRIAGIAPDVQELLAKGLAIYQDGALQLYRDLKDQKRSD